MHTHSYDTCSNTWALPLSLKTARSKIGAAAWFDVAFFGGGEGAGALPLAQVEVLAVNGSL